MQELEAEFDKGGPLDQEDVGVVPTGDGREGAGATRTIEAGHEAGVKQPACVRLDAVGGVGAQAERTGVGWVRGGRRRGPRAPEVGQEHGVDLAPVVVEVVLAVGVILCFQV